MSMIYAREDGLPLADFIAVLEASGLADRRPMAEPERLRKMLDNANLIVTARTPEGRIAGVARCLTDWAYFLYCSDLAVDRACQGQGIGKGLLAKVCELTPDAKSHLLTSAPGAVTFYEQAGYQRIPNAFYFDRFADQTS